MGRAAKVVGLNSKNLTTEEKEKRLETENKLKGEKVKLTPPNYLNKKEKKIYKQIVSVLESGEVLGKLDTYILETCSIAINKLQTVERAIDKKLSELSDEINEDTETLPEDELTLRELLKIKEMYSKDFFRCCSELCLSPQSRAKLGIASGKKKEEDPVINVLKGKSGK